MLLKEKNKVITALHQANSASVSHASRGNEHDRSGLHHLKRKQPVDSSAATNRGRAAQPGPNTSTRGSIMLTEFPKIQEDPATTEDDTAIAKRLNTSETDDMPGPITSGPSPDPYKHQKRERTGTLSKTAGSHTHSRAGGLHFDNNFRRGVPPSEKERLSRQRTNNTANNLGKSKTQHMLHKGKQLPVSS